MNWCKEYLAPRVVFFCGEEELNEIMQIFILGAQSVGASIPVSRLDDCRA